MCLIVGINPSAANKVRKNSALDRLNRWADYLELQHFSFFNVIPNPGPYNQKMIDTQMLLEYSSGYKHVIALGGFVSKALERSHIYHYTMPHPSPLNRLLNSKEYEIECLRSCKKYLES